MTISMYQASAPRFVNMLNNLTSILDKAQAHVDAKKLDAAVLTTYRLFPDMLPMTKQVQIACNTAKGVVARLAGVDIPVHEDNEKDLADLKTRIAKTIAFIQSVTPDLGKIPRNWRARASKRSRRPFPSTRKTSNATVYFARYSSNTSNWIRP